MGTKEELLVGLLHDPVETKRTRLEEVAAQPDPAPERLAAALREYVRGSGAATARPEDPMP